MAKVGDVGVQEDLNGSAIYIHAGENDGAVAINGPKEQERYFKEMGADVQFEIEPNQGHWF